jgi:hypothetical protein
VISVIVDFKWILMIETSDLARTWQIMVIQLHICLFIDI